MSEQQSTMKISPDTKSALEELKWKMKAKSFDAVIQRLIKERRA
jgi:predicted CopG family antitoxin